MNNRGPKKVALQFLRRIVGGALVCANWTKLRSKYGREKRSIKRLQTKATRSTFKGLSLVFTPIKSLIYSQHSHDTTLTKILL